MDFDPIYDLYDVELDWRPLDEQIRDLQDESKEKAMGSSKETADNMPKLIERNTQTLQTVEEEDESNYLSPATSFDNSKHSSKQSLHGIEKSSSGKLVPETVIEDEPISPAPSDMFIDEDAFVFDAEEFDSKAGSPQPTLDETTATSGETGKQRPVDKKHIETDSHTAISMGMKQSQLKSKKPALIGRHRAKISGRNISKYTTPKLPKMRDNRPKFSFWSADSLKGTIDGLESTKSKSKHSLSAGERVSTPYGIGYVVEHRTKSNIVVVDMSGPWKARAYLQESFVARDSSGFFGSILRQFSTAADKQSPRKKSTKSEFELGLTIHTPFGDGKIERLLPLKTPSKHSVSSSKKSTTAEINTISICLKSWTLRDGSHPHLYCTFDTAKEWKEKKPTSTQSHNREGSIFSVIGTLGTLVSGTVESLKKIRVPREIEAPPIKHEAPKFERYYKDGAAVVTSYGDGVVCSFRSADGFYTVKLIKHGKMFATAYLQDDSMSYRLAKGCVEGYPVLTKFGSGVLHSVNPTTGVHNITVPSYGAVLYLQPDQVIRPLKAAVGEDVSTPYGEGKVLKYRLLDDLYEIKLLWGGVLYATANTFDRIDDRMEDKGGFGMNWILQFFYSREDGKDECPQRSRSNSFSMLSQSGVSAKSTR